MIHETLLKPLHLQFEWLEVDILFFIMIQHVGDTAFYLKEGESGVLKYNYRYVSSYGQHYEQYLVYVINTDKLEPDSFIKATYEKSYVEMADLF